MATDTTNDQGQATAALNGEADPGTFTQYTWAALVILLAGDPLTQNNVDNFVTWMQAENGSATWTGTAGANNPLNNGLGSGGGAGLGSYPDLATAALYAAKGIQGGISGAAPINAALKANAPFSVFQAATIKSNWASSHYAGSGYASLTSAASPAAVTVSQAAAHSSTKNPTIGSVTQAQLSATSTLSNIGASANTLTGGAAGAIGSAVGGVTGLENAASTILGDVSSAAFWKRIGIFTAGGVLVIAGIALFVSTTKTGQKVESDAAVATVA